MAKELDIFKEELWEALYKCLDTAFPQMEFVRKAGRWESLVHADTMQRNAQKRHPVTYVYENNPSHIIHKGSMYKCGAHSTLIDFYMEKSGKRIFWEAVKDLCGICGLTPPIYDAEGVREWRTALKKEKRLGLIMEEYRKGLWRDSSAAREVLDYLHGRGWADDEIKIAGLGLAWNCSREAAFAEDGGRDSKLIEEFSRLVLADGVHTLAIPYWVGSRLLGFKCREPRDVLKSGNKYLNSTGMERSTGFFNIRIIPGDLTIVEAEMDALHANAKAGLAGGDGYPVLAASAGTPNDKQIRDALRRGVRKFTLLFDNDEAGRKYALDTIETLGPTDADCYVALLEGHKRADGKDVKDVDELFGAGYTIEDLKNIVDNAESASLYRLRQVFAKYRPLQNKKGYLTPKEKNDLFEDIEKVVNDENLKAIFRKECTDLINSIFGKLDVPADDFMAYVDRGWERSLERKRQEGLKKASKEIADLCREGRWDAMADLMARTAQAAGTSSKAAEWTGDFKHPTSEESERELSEIKLGLPTGYKFPFNPRNESQGSEHLTLNAGLTFICGYRGHGKTSFLNNIAINEIRRQRSIMTSTGTTQAPGGVLYFSYEMDRKRLNANLINVACDQMLSKKPILTINDYFRHNGRDRYFRSPAIFSDFLKAKDEIFTALEKGLLTIVDKPYKVEELLAAIRFYVEQLGNVSLICIDYAQLLYSEAAKGKQRYEEVKVIVNEIKDFANGMGIPFLLAAQFNRDVKSPASVDTSSIGEGGDFERIADTCIGLFALKELKEPPREEEKKETVKILDRFVCKGTTPLDVPPGKLPDGITSGRMDGFMPQLGKLYVRLMKRRYGEAPLDVVLEWNEKTGRIKPNSPRDLTAMAGETETWLEDIMEEEPKGEVFC